MWCYPNKITMDQENQQHPTCYNYDYHSSNKGDTKQSHLAPTLMPSLHYTNAIKRCTRTMETPYVADTSKANKPYLCIKKQLRNTKTSSEKPPMLKATHVHYVKEPSMTKTLSILVSAQVSGRICAPRPLWDTTMNIAALTVTRARIQCVLSLNFSIIIKITRLMCALTALVGSSAYMVRH